MASNNLPGFQFQNKDKREKKHHASENFSEVELCHKIAIYEDTGIHLQPTKFLIEW